jgi:hypothetical protein
VRPTGTGRPPAEEVQSKKSSNAAAIGGGVGGGAAVLIGLACLFFFCRRRKKQHRYQNSPRSEIMEEEPKYAAPTPYMVPVNSLPHTPDAAEPPISPIHSPIEHSIVSPRSDLSYTSATSEDDTNRLSGMTEKGLLAAEQADSDRRLSVASASSAAGSSSGARRTLPGVPLPTHEEDAGSVMHHDSLPPMYETAIRGRTSDANAGTQ